MMKRGVVGIVLIGFVLLSITLASAFSFSDWWNGLFNKNVQMDPPGKIVSLTNFVLENHVSDGYIDIVCTANDSTNSVEPWIGRDEPFVGKYSTFHWGVVGEAQPQIDRDFSIVWDRTKVNPDKSLTAVYRVYVNPNIQGTYNIGCWLDNLRSDTDLMKGTYLVNGKITKVYSFGQWQKICNTGEKRCSRFSTQFVEQCNSSETGWDSYQTCTNNQVCQNGVCVDWNQRKICTPGSNICSSVENAVEQCNSDGIAWNSVQSCTNSGQVCQNGVCAAIQENTLPPSAFEHTCSPGDTWCNTMQNAIYQCNAQGNDWNMVYNCTGNTPACLETYNEPVAHCTTKEKAFKLVSLFYTTENCVETEDGVTGQGLSLSNECDNHRQDGILKVSCPNSTTAEMKFVACPSGTECLGHGCYPSSACVDSDNGLSFSKGWTGNFSYSNTDQCIDKKTLREFSCDGSAVKSQMINCPSGFFCYDGSCLNSSVKNNPLYTYCDYNNDVIFIYYDNKEGTSKEFLFPCPTSAPFCFSGTCVASLPKSNNNCGNNQLDAGEKCDGNLFSPTLTKSHCSDYGLVGTNGNDLTCNNQCNKLDFSKCSLPSLKLNTVKTINNFYSFTNGYLDKQFISTLNNKVQIWFSGHDSGSMPEFQSFIAVMDSSDGKGFGGVKTINVNAPARTSIYIKYVAENTNYIYVYASEQHADSSVSTNVLYKLKKDSSWFFNKNYQFVSRGLLPFSSNVYLNYGVREGMIYILPSYNSAGNSIGSFVYYDSSDFENFNQQQAGSYEEYNNLLSNLFDKDVQLGSFVYSISPFSFGNSIKEIKDSSGSVLLSSVDIDGTSLIFPDWGNYLDAAIKGKIYHYDVTRSEQGSFPNIVGKYSLKVSEVAI